MPTAPTIAAARVAIDALTASREVTGKTAEVRALNTGDAIEETATPPLNAASPDHARVRTITR